MTHKLGHNLVMVWQSIQVTSLKDWIGWGARDNKRVCCEAALTPRTTLTKILAMVWHSIQVTSPSIALDGEPETIKNFAVKQH